MLVFESQSTLGLFEELTGETGVTLDALLDQVIPSPLGDGERNELLECVLPDASWGEAVSDLRDAGVLTEDDVEFCCNELPDTPRTRKLREVLTRYVRSPLFEDRAYRLWSLAEALKEGAVKFPCEEVTFVPAPQPGSLFRDVAGLFSLAEGVEEARVKEFWELAPRNRKGLFLSAESNDCLQRFGARVRALLERGERVLIPFAGSAGEREWLKRFLQHSKRQALVLPFQALPSFPGYRVVAFGGASLWEPPRCPSPLREAERETLNGKGFPVKRLSAGRARNTTFFHAMPGALFAPPESWAQSGLTPKPLGAWQKERAPFRGEWKEETLGGTPRRLSATQLELFNKCPARYFFNYRLYLREKGTPEDRYPLLFGEAVHTTLENYFKETAEGVMEPPDDLPSHLRERFIAVCRELLPDLEPEDPLITTMKAHFDPMADRVPELEAARNAFGETLAPYSMEKEFDLEVMEGVRVKGKIDRIDQAEDGSVLVLDYKTGTVDFSPGHVGKGKNFQALLYLLAAAKLFPQVLGFLFYDLKKGELRRGVLREALLPKDAKKAVTRGHTLTEEKYGELVNEGMDRIRDIIAAMKGGRFRPQPSPEACNFCEYGTHCRERHGL